MWPFKKKSVPLETQLAELAELGLAPTEGVSQDDLFSSHSRAELERAPYRALAETLARAIEREPFDPMCDRLWMCDFERIEDHGDYAAILLRLQTMTGAALAIRDVRDHVDIEEQLAWLEFRLDGRPVRWEFGVQDDWLDPEVFTRYDALLAEAGSGLRLWGCFDGHYGQQGFLAALSAAGCRSFVRLTGIALQPL
jgi:hypothetical protein